MSWVFVRSPGVHMYEFKRRGGFDAASREWFSGLSSHGTNITYVIMLSRTMNIITRNKIKFVERKMSQP